MKEYDAEEIFSNKREEVMLVQRKLYNKELPELYASRTRHGIKGKGKVTTLQARCGPEGG